MYLILEFNLLNLEITYSLQTYYQKKFFLLILIFFVLFDSISFLQNIQKILLTSISKNILKKVRTVNPEPFVYLQNFNISINKSFQNNLLINESNFQKISKLNLFFQIRRRFNNQYSQIRSTKYLKFNQVNLKLFVIKNMQENKKQQLFAQQITMSSNKIQTNQNIQEIKLLQITQNKSQVSIIGFKCGGIYLGSTKDNKRNGEGKQFYSNGNYYEGEWSQDLQDGIGLFKYNTGDFYQGEFFQGQFQGFGKYFYAQSKRLYIGFWLNSKWHGQGSFYSDQGDLLIDGIWECDNLIQENIQINKNITCKNEPNTHKKQISIQSLIKKSNQIQSKDNQNSFSIQNIKNINGSKYKSLLSNIKNLLFQNKHQKLKQCLIEQSVII
ncbi:MORN motif protein (macronuclear) [Tetrahymena thermophila SB210]|uniref:MORN motif protein n=1 Tax=Tetrahymena thermophila (strain SB210) TaxID=312017 RepID=I7MG92_TETTS|nr:MORN motif protein [Tetrahymena thermophila SB210]EAR84935.2 MORN motif protein [Tetrahymena thermophila SB210]|eukprot:XP_001032598.2 MORN motif protein [Tetrahymena thermophila SB210]